MKRRIEKAVVLGAGTMGSRIAAHFANAGLPCILLDIVPPDLPADAPADARNKIVRAGLDVAKKAKPAAFFTACAGGAYGDWEFRGRSGALRGGGLDHRSGCRKSGDQDEICFRGWRSFVSLARL